VQSVAQNSERITDSATNAATGAHQMERSIRSVAAMAKESNEITTRLGRETEESGAIAQKSIEGMMRVRDQMQQAAGVIKEMGKRSNEIGSIVDTINIIAERTNMLSLNASIEAARAGDAGRGFAVVAEEIRNLAERSAKATADIAAIIRALQETVLDAVNASSEGVKVADEGNRLAEEGLKGLEKILSGVRETTGLVGQISRATEEQISAGQAVVTAVESTAKLSKEVSAATSEQAKTIQQIVQSAVQMRKTTKEVVQAMNEQARAAREIIKAAQSTTSVAEQLRRATSEQSAAANQIVQAVESMRRGAVMTTRAIGEQSTASEQVSVEATRLTTMIASVARAMNEQAASSRQISIAAVSMRQQSEQIAKALDEQSRAMREMTTSSNDVAKQIKLITRANVEHSIGADNILQTLSNVRQITERNARGVEATLTETTGLLAQAQELAAIMNDLETNDGAALSPGDAPKGEKTGARKKGAARAAKDAGTNGSAAE
jgi:methyl-accepting chemotaxis protein